MKWILLFLLMIPLVSSQLVLDFPSPEVLNMSVRQTPDGIFCNANTNEGSWPIYRWFVNGEFKREGQILDSGYSSSDEVRCEVVATTGYENATAYQMVNITSSAPLITGAVIGTAQTGGNILGILLLTGFLIGLVVVNYRLFVRHKDNSRKRKLL